MSGQRLSRLPENQLDTALTTLEQQLTEIKAGAPQYIGGASIVVTKSQTANTFDWNGFLNDPSGLGIGGKLFQVTATATHMSAFWGNAGDDLYVDTSTNYYDGLHYMTDYKNNNAPIATYWVDVPNTSPTPNSKSWFVQVSGNSTRHLWIKFWVYGLDAATVTVTALS